MAYTKEIPYGNTKVKVRVPIWIAIHLLVLLFAAIFPEFSQAAEVTLQWDSVLDQNVESYRLYSRIDNGNYDYSTPLWQAQADECSDGTVATCKLPNLQDNALYHFVVRAVDFAGNESGDSNEVTFDTYGLVSTSDTSGGSSEPADDGSDAGDTIGDGSEFGDSSSEEVTDDDSGSDGVTQEEIGETFPEIPSDGNTPPDDPTNDENNGNLNAPDDPGFEYPINNSVDVDLEVELATGDFSDADPNDSHAYTRWLIHRDTGTESTCVFDRVSDHNLVRIKIPPLVLDPETEYYWTAIHYDQAGAPSTPGSSSYFTTAPWTEDSGNPNGIPDGYESFADTDLDRNGEPDGSQSDIKCFLSIFGDQTICVKLTSGCQEDQLLAAQPVDPGTIVTPMGEQPIMPFGLVNFKVQLAPETQAAYVTVYFSDAIENDLFLLIYDPVWGYADYSFDSSVSQNHKTVTMYIEDGNTGDMDGVENGIIVTLAGYGTIDESGSSSNNDSSQSSGLIDPGPLVSDWEWEPGNSNCFIDSLF